MKVDRRSFLGLGLGAVAGIAVSPVGIKLTDDSSIWTQNWPWTPVPVDGEVNYKNSVCSLCPGSCGVSVRMIDDRPVKIEGRNDYPVNEGGACLHGIAGLQYLYDPSRIKTPLRKTDAGFIEISWEDAIAQVAQKLAPLRKEGNPEKLACIADKDQGSVSILFQRLLASFGSPNFYTMPSLDSNMDHAAIAMHGKGKTIGFDLENADFVLSFGAGIIEGWGSPVSCFKANASRKERHATLYQIEPRLSNTAANADQWLPINPGTEADLALGLCAIILEKKWFDPDAVGLFKGGFNKFVAMVTKKYSPDQTSMTTGITEDVLKKTAKAFAKAKMPVAVFGKGRGDGPTGLKEICAVQTLNGLVGNYNKKGGVFIRPKADYLKFPEIISDKTAAAGLAKSKAGQNISAFIQKAADDAEPPVEALFVYNANPCFSMHDAKKATRAISNIPFVVSFSSFLDETAMAADIILPSHTFMERLEDVPSGGGLATQVVGLTKPIVGPVFNTKDPGDAVIMIAQALEGVVAQNFEWSSYEACLKNTAGNIWKDLSGQGFSVISQGPPANGTDVNIGFLSGNPATTQAQGDGKLMLIPIDNMRLPSTALAASPFAVKTLSDTVLKGKDIVIEINPETGKSNGLKDGGFATLTTAIGKARVKVGFNHGIMPGVIGMVEGLGHTFDNPFVANKGVNVNELIGPVFESGSGLDAAFGIRANISKA